MHRRLLDLGCHQTASGQNEVRIRLAIAILEVEASEKDDCGCYWDLSEEETFAEFLHEVGEPYSEAVELAGAGVSEVDRAGMEEGGAWVEMVVMVRGGPEAA